MQVFNVADAAVREFMQRLLRENIFDAFDVRGVDLVSFTGFEIDGIDRRETERRKFCRWSELRPHIHEIVKSGPKPKTLKIIFSLAEETAAAFHPNAAALFINLLYENGAVALTAAAGQKNFSLDKSMEQQWDMYAENFLTENKIDFARG
ncbi:MAG: DUF5721 family protein [Defluviitaleaceae bacterium]|nr:DUF5721 family protein [Defluviitaleaceae bacterium]